MLPALRSTYMPDAYHLTNYKPEFCRYLLISTRFELSTSKARAEL